MSSTFDRRRIQAPESSHAPIYSDEPEAGPSRSVHDDPSEIFLKTGLINQANGSAYIESGKVKIACSVYGPRPKPPPYSPRGTLSLELKFAPFASHPRRAPLRDTEPAAPSAILTQLILPSLHLHLLPKSAIDVFLMVLESDTIPEMLSAAHTVATAAIADAGIAMSGLGVGSVIKGTVTGDEQSLSRDKGECSVTLGVLPALNKVTNIWLTGSEDLDQVCDDITSLVSPADPVQMIDKGVEQGKRTHTVVAQALLEGAEARGL